MIVCLYIEVDPNKRSAMEALLHEHGYPFVDATATVDPAIVCSLEDIETIDYWQQAASAGYLRPLALEQRAIELTKPER
jgi:hypothetical protein